MVANADGFYAYRTAPHIDEHETGLRTVELLRTALSSRRRLVTCMRPVPLLIAGEQSETDKEPARSLYASLEEEDRRPGVLRASYVLGFPWADSVHGGAAALVTGFLDARPELESTAARMADRMDRVKDRFRFTTEAHPPEEALRLALEDPTSPVFVSDSGDNPTAGATQETTGMLRLLLGHPGVPALFTALTDPASVRRCREAGVGAEVSLSLPDDATDPGGGTTLSVAGPVRVLAQVHGTEYAVVGLGDVDLVLCRTRTDVTDPRIMEALGLDLRRYKVVVIKSGYLSPEYKAVASRSILALSDGDTCEILQRLPYRRLKRPIYPLDP
jgi:microcystin degradation protein MlrC